MQARFFFFSFYFVLCLSYSIDFVSVLLSILVNGIQFTTKTAFVCAICNSSTLLYVCSNQRRRWTVQREKKRIHKRAATFHFVVVVMCVWCVYVKKFVVDSVTTGSGYYKIRVVVLCFILFFFSSVYYTPRHVYMFIKSVLLAAEYKPHSFAADIWNGVDILNCTNFNIWDGRRWKKQHT